MRTKLLGTIGLTAMLATPLASSVLPHAAQAQDDGYQSSDQSGQSGDPGAMGNLGTKDEISVIQADAQSEMARSSAAAASALTSLDEGPVHPQVLSTPPGVTVAAPAAPMAAPLPPIDYAKLPPDLARPVTIKWDGPVSGAIAALAQQINYTAAALTRM